MWQFSRDVGGRGELRWIARSAARCPAPESDFFPLRRHLSFLQLEAYASYIPLAAPTPNAEATTLWASSATWKLPCLSQHFLLDCLDIFFSTPYSRRQPHHPRYFYACLRPPLIDPTLSRRASHFCFSLARLPTRFEAESWRTKYQDREGRLKEKKSKHLNGRYKKKSKREMVRCMYRSSSLLLLRHRDLAPAPT